MCDPENLERARQHLRELNERALRGYDTVAETHQEARAQYTAQRRMLLVLHPELRDEIDEEARAMYEDRKEQKRMIAGRMY